MKGTLEFGTKSVPLQVAALATHAEAMLGGIR
jgi:hypothetical protein